MKRCYSRIRTVFLVVTAAILTLPLTKQAFGSNLPEDIISQDIVAQNNHDINSFLSLRPNGTDFPEDQSIYQNIWRMNPQDNFIYNIISAKLVGEKAIPLDIAEKVTNIESYLQEDSVVKAFYVAIDYKVKVETKYLYNRINYRFYVLVLDHGKYLIAEASSAPVPLLESLGFGFSTKTEGMVSSLQSQALKTGLLELPDGNIVSRVTAYTQPSTIRVYITASGTISTVIFSDYVKNVLPNEWFPTWQSGALQTGALAVKMFGWWRTINPRNPSAGYDVLDNTSDQVYKAGSAQASTNSAADAVSGVGFAQADGSIFESQYWAGAATVSGTGSYLKLHSNPDTLSSDVIGKAYDGDQLIVLSSGLINQYGHTWWLVKTGGTSNWNSSSDIVGWVAGDWVYYGSSSINSSMKGRMTQWGTEYWSEQGKNYNYMVPYYYNGSSQTNHETVQFFSYAPPSAFSASITGLQISPTQVNPGNTFTISYTVNATSAGSVILGASILDSAGTGSWISDSPHDLKVSLNSGINTVSRQFTVPSSISPLGTYDLDAALWLDVNNNGVIDPGVDQSLDSKLYLYVLSVVSANIQVTVGTYPAGLSFSVDGTNYATTKTFSWTPTSSHTIATTSPQTDALNTTQHVWSNWSDGGTMSHSVAPTSNTTYTATFTTKYYLILSAGTGGTTSPAPSGSWYNSGSTVQITAIPNTGYQFSGWSGSVSGSTNPITVTMNSPMTVTANFSQIVTAGTLSVSPSDGLNSSGNQGGPFSPSSKIYTLTNTGGNTINWSASKSQSWVTLSSAGGQLSAGANTSVTVSINTNANSLSTGSYSDNVSFSNTTNGNGNTSRAVSLAVSSIQARPNWYSTPTSISHVIAIPLSSNPNIDGVPLSSSDYIGVFYDSLGTLACGGYTPWNTSLNGSVTAWGNDQSSSNPDGFASGETFKWKIWRASDQKTFDAIAAYLTTDPSIPNTDKFVTNGISKLTALSATSMAQQQIALTSGWQIISSYVSPSYASLDSVFEPIKNSIIMAKDGSGNVYWPAQQVNSIVNWRSSRGYQIKMQNNGVLNVIGNQIAPESTPISIPKGWSIIAYLRNQSMAIDAALNSVSSKIIMVKNGIGGVYWPSQNVNSIANMNPGEGYQIKMSDSATLIYPANVAPTSSSLKMASTQKVSIHRHFGVPEPTDNSAVILFPVKVLNSILLPGDEIGIYDGDGLLCGSGVYEGENLAVTVFGDDKLSKVRDGFVPGDKFQVKIYSRKSETQFNSVSVVYLDGDNTYQVNGINIVSSLSLNKYKFTGNAELEVLSNYPNPFNPTTTIAYNLRKTQAVRISLYNILGQLVATLVNGVQTEGQHQLEITGDHFSSGVYEVVFQVGNTFKTIKVDLIK